MNKKLWSLIAVPVLLMGCGGPAAEQAEAGGDGEGGELPTLTVALPSTSCLVSAENYVAQTNGLYEEEGVNINIEAVNGSAGVLQAIAAGQADFGGPGATPVLAALDRGEEITYFLNVRPGGSFFLVTNSDSGIEEASDLEGKTIGVATADGNEVSFVDAIMSNEGVPTDDYEKLTVGEGGTAVAAFERGEIDAYAASSDGYATIENAGIEMTDLTTDSVDYMFGNGYAAPASVIEEQSDALVAYSRAWARAAEQIADDPQVALDACSEFQPQEVEDEEYALSILDLIAQNSEPLGDNPWGTMQEEDWDAILTDAVEAGIVADDSLDMSEAFTNDIADQANE